MTTDAGNYCKDYNPRDKLKLSSCCIDLQRNAVLDIGNLYLISHTMYAKYGSSKLALIVINSLKSNGKTRL